MRGLAGASLEWAFLTSGASGIALRPFAFFFFHMVSLVLRILGVYADGFYLGFDMRFNLEFFHPCHLHWLAKQLTLRPLSIARIWLNCFFVIVDPDIRNGSGFSLAQT